MSKRYAERDVITQGQFYVDHVMAMTAEKLHAKSDIAAELAHRDIELERVKMELAIAKQYPGFISSTETNFYVANLTAELERVKGEHDEKVSELVLSEHNLGVKVAALTAKNARLREALDKVAPSLTHMPECWRDWRDVLPTCIEACPVRIVSAALADPDGGGAG